jgi:hypothetical protein
MERSIVLVSGGGAAWTVRDGEGGRSLESHVLRWVTATVDGINVQLPAAMERRAPPTAVAARSSGEKSLLWLNMVRRH